MAKDEEENCSMINKDIPLVLNNKAIMIGRQIVVYVGEKTFNDVKRDRNGKYEKIEQDEHFYMDDAAICLIRRRSTLDKPYSDDKKGTEVAEIIDKILAMDNSQLEDLHCTLQWELGW